MKKLYRVAVPAALVFYVEATDEDAARREALKNVETTDDWQGVSRGPGGASIRGGWAVGCEIDGTEFARAYVNSGLTQSDVIVEANA